MFRHDSLQKVISSILLTTFTFGICAPIDASPVASVTVTAPTTNYVHSPIQAGTTTYAYDAKDRVVKQTNPDGSFIAYARDANGNITQRSTPMGTANYAFNSKNLLTSVTDYGGKVTTYTYDDIGRLVTTTMPDGGITYLTYDNNNRMLQVLHVTNSGSVIGGNVYTLNLNGQRLQMLEFDGASTVLNKVISNPARTTAYLYDGFGRLTEEKLTDRTGTVVSTIDYQYDPVGNRTQKTIATAAGIETITYSYNSNDWLTQETDSVGATQTQTIYAWDANGNLLSKTTAGHVTLYRWDSDNRLAEVDQGTSQATATPIAWFSYDPKGNRVQKFEPGQNGQPERVTTYLNDGTFANSETLLETVKQGTSTTTTAYTWGNSLIGMNSSGVQSYVHADGLGSIKILTNATGNVTDTYSYDAFGNQIGRTGSTVNPYRYTGEYFDDAIALQYNRARWYDPTDGRFVSMDTFLGRMRSPVTLNKYAYANADPINGTDPSGLADLVQQQTAMAGFGIISIQTIAYLGSATLGAAFLDIYFDQAVMINNDALADDEINDEGVIFSTDQRGTGYQALERHTQYVQYKTGSCKPDNWEPDSQMSQCLKWVFKRNAIQKCIADRQAWDDKWAPGLHAGQIAEITAAVSKMAKKIANNCLGTN